MSDDNQNNLYTLIGELKADVRSVLRAIESNKEDMNRLREEVRNETIRMNDVMRDTHNNMYSRLSKVERFQAKILAYGTVAITIGTAIMSWAIPALLKMVTGS